MYLNFILISTLCILLIDLYYYRILKYVIKGLKRNLRQIVKVSYFLFTLFTLGLMFFLSTYFLNKVPAPKFVRIYIIGTILIITFSKIIGIFFLIIYDVIKLINWIINNLSQKKVSLNRDDNSISRKAFLKKTALIATIIPFGTLMFGVLKSAFDFNIHKHKVKIINLPTSFKGLKIVQISDIHSGSFISDEPLKNVVKLIKEQNPDIIFFTGDLVNEITEEVLPYIDVLKQISAPMGVFSILGNHDYGDYFYQKDDFKNKEKNYKLMKSVHQNLGWKLLLNEHQIIEKNNERIAIIGVENWGSEARFQKYGDIDKAKKGCLKSDIKLLLSHDPSHWDAQVISKHPDISMTFSGHTHGMQFGIEIPGFKWSPSQYLYKCWAGLYQQNNQKLYVNRGLGFIGYPGRVGILPEITVFELT